MRHAIVIAFAAAASLACGRPGPGGDPPLPSVGAAPAAATAATGDAAAAVEPTYRVPIDGLPVLGDPRALVTVVSFSDYQCPFCKRAEATITQLRAAYGSDLRLVVAEHPLPMHETAQPGALAALAAASMGALEPMRARLYVGPIDDATITAAARDLGLDLRRFDAERAGPAVAALARSQALGEQLGVTGTPTFFINGRRVQGAQPIETFRAVIDEQLAAARALVANGVRPEDVYAHAIAGGLEHVAPSEGSGPGCAAGACNGKPGDPPPVGDAVESVPVEGAPSRGPVTARITVVEFADYQCPFCARAEATVQAIEQAHPGQVRVVFKDDPLPFHDRARPMALAALAADRQGGYWAMHDRLFKLAGPADQATLDRLAGEAGLDVARFDHDLADPAVAERLATQLADATSLGVTGTPTFFVNGHRVVGAQPVAVFEQAIAR